VANWLGQHEEEVENLKVIELDALREACWITTQARIERLSARLEHITTEPDKRDFSEVPTAKLVELELKTRAELVREFAEPHIRSEQEPQHAKADGTALTFPEMRSGGDTTLSLGPEESGNGRNGHATLSKRGGFILGVPKTMFKQARTVSIRITEANSRLRRSARAYSAG
jgi:hypothetical protein